MVRFGRLPPESRTASARPAHGQLVRDATTSVPEVVLSFDVEEHDRIEAAAGLTLGPAARAYHRGRLGPATRWVLDLLDQVAVRATFFVVGEIAARDPGLVREIHRAGHEVASHGWDHRRIHTQTPAAFREDVRTSLEALGQVTGEAVVGYRAPTFSIVRRTAWALDILAELGLRYDSSIFPVRHDRYGVPGAPFRPFLAEGMEHAILELPPLTLRLLGSNLPVGGGGYFRLLPTPFLEAGLRQADRCRTPGAAVLYFHPWEFDPAQERLPLSRVGRFRTYAGIRGSQVRLAALLERRRFTRAVDAARRLDPTRQTLPRYRLAPALPRVFT